MECQAGRVRDLVALDLPGGPAFLAALRSVWAAGDAVLPVDQRLPDPARRALVEAARPKAVISPTSPATPASPGPGANAPAAWHRVVLDQRAPPVGDDDAVVVASSGSTGSPKLVVHTRAAITAHARAVHHLLGVDAGTDRWLACLPLSHLGGLGVVLRSVVTDTPVDLLPGFDADEVATAPERLGTTLVSLVPTALGRVDADRYRWVVLGGAADHVRRPGNVVHTYGLTESGGGIVYDGVPLDDVEVAVATDGAISLRGPVLARGTRAPDGTVDPCAGPDGWLATGDVGRWVGDAGGPDRLVVDGRADDLIVTGGENVWPDAVEARLRSHPGVAEVAVVGRPDPAWGQRVVAAVVPVDASAPPTLRDLRDHVRSHLPAHCAPREVVTRSWLPRTALGKVRRQELVATE